ncbi:MAG TPA: hypothetical protein PKG56_02130 [Chitinophagaceae bacterium]|nr:hypothetical protein [Chitinophagaceae bacterium]HNL82165.1 hypothetical protein [Chitinophagaceae bacterium]HNM33613.1 hypothetical protein [Chitinophagaceae bacterium]
MKDIQKFKPSFLLKLDERLLKNNPTIWSTKIHWVIWYSILFIILLSIISFVVPLEFRRDSVNGYWIVFVSIISFISFVIWLIYLLQFNVFKRFGNFTALDSLKQLLLYYTCILCFMTFPFVFSVVEVVRVNSTYNSKELINDINKINLTIAQIEYDSIQHNWNRDTVWLVADLNKIDTQQRDSIPKITQHSKYAAIDSATFNSRKKITDSVIDLGNNLYVFVECPVYSFLNIYNAKDIGEDKILKSASIFNLVIKNYKPAPKDSLQSLLKTILNKYSINNYQSSINTEFDEQGNNSHLLSTNEIFKKYNLWSVERSIENIFRIKNRWAFEEMKDILRVVLYFTLILSLLVYIFRHSTVKTFFLSLLTAKLLTIISGLVIALFDFKGYAVYEWYFFYVIFFLFLSIMVFTQSSRKVVTGIAINLFTLIFAFLPLMFVFYYNERARLNYIINDINYQEKMKTINLYLSISEIVLVVLILLIIPTFIFKMYRKWYALPES